MPWGRLDDTLYDHPKVDALPARLRNACLGLWVRAISYSNRYLTDGAVPTDRLRKLDGRTAEVNALVAVGLFDRTPTGVTVHDFLAFNDSADEVRQKRLDMRELGKRGGKASGQARRFPETKRDASPQRSTETEAAGLNPRPVPSESPPSPPKRERRTKTPRAAGTNPRSRGTSPRQARGEGKPISLSEVLRRAAAEGRS